MHQYGHLNNDSAVQMGVGASRVLQSGTLKNVNLQNSELGDEGAMLLATMLTAKLQTNLQVTQGFLG